MDFPKQDSTVKAEDIARIEALLLEIKGTMVNLNDNINKLLNTNRETRAAPKIEELLALVERNLSNISTAEVMRDRGIKTGRSSPN